MLVYGAIDGLRTVADFDLGWQMADARNPWSSVDALSYTVPGAPWVYPPLAGIVFRNLLAIGGYAAISWLCALAVLATLAIVAVRSKPAVLLLLLIAVPSLAGQMIPRSGLFTIVLAAAYTRLLLSYYLEGNSRRLWLLPLLMALWINLHTGFIAGLGLMLGYLAAEAIDLMQASKRDKARRQLRAAAPWIIASVICTLLNPWGPRIYSAIAAQERVSTLQSSVIVELTPLYREFSWHGLQLLSPISAIWWMLAASVVAIALLLYKKRFGLALFLAFAFIACLLSARTQGIFLPIACLIAGEAFRDLQLPTGSTWRPIFSWVTVALAIIFVAWRCDDIVADRTSLREDQITLFGAGASWWLPQDAAAFIEAHHLPTELFSTFNLSSYLTWRLGPHYRDFADGRYLPFGDRIVSEQMRLSSLPLDSSEWSRAAERYHIRTVILPLSRFWGVEAIPLSNDCASRQWSPVYFDPTAIVFVRNDALPQAMPKVDCQRVQLVSTTLPPENRRTLMEHYQRLANAAVLYFLLGRNEDAQRALGSAWQISQDDRSLLLLHGQLQTARNEFGDAENTFRSSLKLHESDAAWNQLGLLYARQGRYTEATHAFQQTLRLSARPVVTVELSLAKAEVLGGEVNAALQTLEDAARTLPENTPAARAAIDDVQVAAYSQLANWPAAIAAGERAVQETPDAASRWKVLAALYAATGQQEQALRAQARAAKLAPEASH